LVSDADLGVAAGLLAGRAFEVAQGENLALFRR
jgi:hypothetical protein